MPDIKNKTSRKINVMIPDIRDRIAKVVTYKYKNVNAFGVATGLSRQLLYDIVGRNRHMPTVETIHKILSAVPEIDPVWLLLGKGQMLVADNQPAPARTVAKNATAQPTPIIPSFDQKPKRPLLASKSINLTWSAPVRALPGVKASAGTGNINEAITEGQTKILTIPGLSPSQAGGYLGLYADGDSMQPAFEDGDLIVIDQILRPEFELRVDQLYVILTKSDESYIKRLSNIDLTNLLFTSDNLQYPAFSVPVTEIQSIYRVVLRLTKSLDRYTPPAVDDILSFYGDRISKLEGRS